MLKRLDDAYGRFLWALMALAAVYVGLIMVAIVYLTVFRSMGWAYSKNTPTFIEYGFIYILFFGSPYLIRHRGHVYIELLTAAVPDRARVFLSRAIALICAIVCAIWVYYTFELLLQHIEFETYDELRSDVEMFRWYTTWAWPFGFLLMGIEFLRYVFTAEPMHTGLAGVASERAELEETKAAIAKEGR